MKQHLVHLAAAAALFVAAAASQSIIQTLPGYDGTLPFNLETGYIGVGDNDEIQMFYYFIQSQGDPSTDPLFLWLTGGPGCSAFSGLVYEIGPLAFDIANFDGSLPSFVLNPYSWTKVASIIFLDSPVGTGFSYSNTSQSFPSSDTKAALDNYTFLRKWLNLHPTFLKNRLYIAGDSYGGKIVPMVALHVAQGNEAGLHPIMSLKGYIIGNPVIDEHDDSNERIPYAHRMALISDQHFQLAQRSCNGEYESPDPNNFQCLYALQLTKECMDMINTAHILEPKCSATSPNPNPSDSRFLVDDPGLLTLSSPPKLKCRNQRYVTSYIWANDESVREALHIRKGTVGEWTRCCKRIVYDHDLQGVVEYHDLLGERGLQALIYSGDHDMVVPYMATLKRIQELNASLDELWRPWIVDAQIAGYTQKYKHNKAQAYIVFATVKGGGHTAPEYKPKECLTMIQRWLSLYPL